MSEKDDGPQLIVRWVGELDADGARTLASDRVAIGVVEEGAEGAAAIRVGDIPAAQSRRQEIVA
jgi:hypothetical protein